MSDLDFTFVDEAVRQIGTGTEKVLELLQAIQGHYRYLPREALERVCELTDITPSSIAGVSTFYNQFRHRPVGRHVRRNVGRKVDDSHTPKVLYSELGRCCFTTGRCVETRRSFQFGDHYEVLYAGRFRP